MKKLVAFLLLSTFLVPVASGTAEARDHRRDNRPTVLSVQPPKSVHHHYHKPQPRGYWHTGWHNGRHGRWWVVANNWVYYPVAAPVYRPRPVPVVLAPQPPVSALWFGFNF